MHYGNAPQVLGYHRGFFSHAMQAFKWNPFRFHHTFRTIMCISVAIEVLKKIQEKWLVVFFFIRLKNAVGSEHGHVSAMNGEWIEVFNRTARYQQRAWLHWKIDRIVGIRLDNRMKIVANSFNLQSVWIKYSLQSSTTSGIHMQLDVMIWAKVKLFRNRAQIHLTC